MRYHIGYLTGERLLLIQHLGRERGDELGDLRKRRDTLGRREFGDEFTGRGERGDLSGFDLFDVVERLSLDSLDDFEIGGP